MKRFEFTLARVLDIRRKQADIAVAQMLTLNSRLATLQQEEQSLKDQFASAEIAVKQAGSSLGADLSSLSLYGEHIRSQVATVQRRQQVLRKEIQEHTEVCVEADRKVKLLENLEMKQRSEWTISSDKELEALAADSHLALLLAGRRSKNRFTMEEIL